MELILTKGKIKIDNLIMPCVMFIAGLGIVCSNVEIIKLCFILPIAVGSYLCGYQYIISFIMILVSSLLLPESNVFLVTSSLIVLLFLQIFSYIKVIKTQMLPILVGILMMIMMYINNYNYLYIILCSTLIIINEFIIIKLIPVLIHNKIDVYTNNRIMLLSVIVLISFSFLYRINIIYLMILMRVYILMISYYFSVETVLPALLYTSIILLINDISLKDQLLSIILPLSLFFIYKPKNKLLFIGMYLMYHIILPFFINYHYQTYAIIVVSSALLFILIPTIKWRPLSISDNYKDITRRDQLTNKAVSFAELFRKLTDIFKDTSLSLNPGEYVGYVYEDVCSGCSSKEYCFYGKDGVNRLGKLISKGIKDRLDDNDNKYIEKNCIYPVSYLKTVKSYHDSYQKMLRIDRENNVMQNNLFNEFALIGDVFSNFSSSITYSGNTVEDIKDHLEAYRFNVVYINKTNNYEGYILELGIQDIDKRIVKEELVPILSNYLDEKLEIVSIRDSKRNLSYTSVVLKHCLSYEILYGMQQFSLDKEECGDSYMEFKHNNHFFMALSDGMGQGHSAAKESKLTLEVISKLLMNGISLKDTINTINSLLRIKNNGNSFTTLDMCDFNLANAKLKLIKYGAFTSYHIRNFVIDEISSQSLPVGITSQLKVISYDVKLKNDDIIILASDGVGNNFYETIQKNLHKIVSMHPTKIATFLIGEVLNQDCLDDISVIVMKVKKIA